MRRAQFYLDNDLYEALSAEAARLGTSRASIVRDALRTSLARHTVDTLDPLDELVGSVDIDPIDDIDEVIYGYNG
ncbi:MAG: ribbon-helix-helix domain-containing protein [Chloroflexi bacterium]|nr:ribbon-helix-helix domain-containing protein [Chloroflexota bacterium]